jgi:dipeptidase E
LGVLELSVLPSIDEECWVPSVQETDALLVWGGDPVFLSYWMRRSGLADVLPSLPSETVYLGGERREHWSNLHLCRDLPRSASRQR